MSNTNWREMLGVRAGKPGGITLTIVLFVVSLLFVIVSVVVQQGIGSVRQARLADGSKQGLFAAEAGAADAFRHLIEDPAWAGPLSLTTMEGGALYSAVIVNNLTGSTEQIAPDGAKVPVGFAYIFATGLPYEDGVTRHVGVLVKPGSASALNFAIGVGGALSMAGHTDIYGSVKANGNIDLSNHTAIIPVNNNGRLLSSANISAGGHTTMDEAQDIRARGTVDASGVDGPYLIQSNDTSDSTAPFINDGRTNNSLNPGETGQVLPNPDIDLLLPPDPAGVATYDPAVVVVHSETTPATDPFDTTGMVHYFVNGFTAGGDVTGGGMILTTDGDKIRIPVHTTIDADLVALGDLATVAGTDLIDIAGHCDITGLVYSHGGVDISGHFTLNGLIITYKGDLDTHVHCTIKLDSGVLAGVPGFDTWKSGYGGEGGPAAGQAPITVLSWERQ